MDKLQQQYFLRQQMKAIQKELGEGDGAPGGDQELPGQAAQAPASPTRSGRSSRSRSAAWPRCTRSRPRRPSSATTSTGCSSLPWSKTTVDNLDLVKARKILDEDHYGLEKVKERILEYLAVRKLVQDDQGPDPLLRRPARRGQDLARPVHRPGPGPQVRPHLAGRRPRRGRDPRPPPDLRRRHARPHHPGHPAGRVEQPGLHAGRDRQDRRRLPRRSLARPCSRSSTRSRTTRFRDHYLDVPYDLSQGACSSPRPTCSTRSSRPSATAWRSSSFPGYTEEEKLEIARRHLVPKQIDENGLTRQAHRVHRRARSRGSSRDYTREAGVRNLEREIAAVCRKVARKVAEGKQGPDARSRPRPSSGSSGRRRSSRTSS